MAWVYDDRFDGLTFGGEERHAAPTVTGVRMADELRRDGEGRVRQADGARRRNVVGSPRLLAAGDGARRGDKVVTTKLTHLAFNSSTEATMIGTNRGCEAIDYGRDIERAFGF